MENLIKKIFLVLLVALMAHAVMAQPHTTNRWKGICWGGSWKKWLQPNGLYDPRGVNSDLENIAYAGGHWVRVNFSQDESIEALRQKVDAAKSAGLRVLFVYYKRNPSKTYGTEEQEAQNATYLKAIVREFKDYIKHWEIHNEPNLRDYWILGPSDNDSTYSEEERRRLYNEGVHKYVKHLRRCYDAIKAEDPGAIVILGGLSEWRHERFMDRLTVEEAYKWVDEVAFHPYGNDASHVARRLRAFKIKMGEWPEGYQDKPIWITEFGFQSIWSDKQSKVDSEEEKAEFLALTYNRLLDSLPAKVRRPIFWYTLHESGGIFDGFGLVKKGYNDDRSGVVDTLLPAIETYRALDDTPRPNGRALYDVVFADGPNGMDYSVRENLQPGDKQYGDRDYTFTGIPNFMRGLGWIQTANDSKNFKGDSPVSFRVRRKTTVYVAVSTNTPRLAWLDGWSTLTSELTNSRGATSRIFRKEFNAGANVVLGKVDNNDASFYTVILNPSLIYDARFLDTANEAGWSVQNNIQVNRQQYGDRDYTFTELPSDLTGKSWIRTANDSKSYSGNTVATFKLSRKADVFLLTDSRIADGSLDWLQGWELTGETAENSEPLSYKIYKKGFDKDVSVSLGAVNNSQVSFYTVIADPVFESPININGVTVGAQHPVNTAEKSYDGQQTTRWSSDGNVTHGWIRYTFREASIRGVKIKFYKGNTRTYPITLHVDDTKVFEGATTKTSGYWSHSFDNVRGSSLEIALTGDNSDDNGWISIYEVEIYFDLKVPLGSASTRRVEADRVLPVDESEWKVVHPNPVEERLYLPLSAAGSDDLTVVIRSGLGDQVYRGKAELHNGTPSIDTRFLAPGYYFIKIGDDGHWTRIVKR